MDRDATEVSPIATEHLADAIRFSLSSLDRGAYVVAGMVARGFAGCRSVRLDTVLLREAAIRTDSASYGRRVPIESFDYAACYEASSCDAVRECCDLDCDTAAAAGRRYCDGTECERWYEAFLDQIQQACRKGCANERAACDPRGPEASN